MGGNRIGGRFVGVEWGDLRAVYDRMKSRRLFPLTGPARAAGYLLTVATFARAARREGCSCNISNLLDIYAEYSGEEPAGLRAGIEAHWRGCGQWPASAEEIVEVLSRP